ncbi:MAG: type II toxin-antitoxin system RelE/ParE family toxin [Phascolarctobacterium sp.]|nr:type II toxin-antitoxin system RelE/ParE family toxin [Phascolarctobacterium sp.]
MNYKVDYTNSAIKNLKALDKPVRNMVLNWIEKNLIGCSNPRQHGKALVGNHSGKWRYRVGDYRIIADILDDKIIILVLNVGHRKEIY